MTRDPEFEARCTAIADCVVPKYRHGDRSYSCGGTIAKMWQAAWDGACAAYGRDPSEFVWTPDQRLLA